MRAREKRQSALLKIRNINEAEEGRRRVKLAECVRSEDKRGRTRESYHVLYRSLKARLSYFPVKPVIIANEFAIDIEVTILSCDGLVDITNEFAIILKTQDCLVMFL